jgi:RNA polymerase sigma-70 factor (ECF subfamily)
MDASLMQRLAEGDVQAFAVFYNTYSPAVYNAAMTFSRQDQLLAEEVVQVVFIKIWEKRATLTGIHQVEAYLYTLAKNLILDIFRQKAREENRARQLELNESGEATTPANLLIAREYAGIFKKAIASLSPQQKKVYELAREAGLSHAEIAAQTGLTILTVRTHLKLANKSVRQYVARYIEDPDYLMVIFFLSSIPVTGAAL